MKDGTIRKSHPNEPERKSKYISIFFIIGVIGIWWVATNYFNIKDIFLPKPQDVIKAFYTLCVDGYGIGKQTLFVHLSVSIRRLLIAFVLSVATAVPLGLLSGCAAYVHAVINPFVEFYRPLPPLAYYTLLVLWLGISVGSKITLLYLAGFAPIYVACVQGVKKVNRDVLCTAHILGANKVQAFFSVILPSSLPDIFTGIRTAIGVEYTTLVSAEMVAAKVGIGWMVLDASNWLKSDVVFVGIILMGATGVLLNYLILIVERRIVHWYGK